MSFKLSHQEIISLLSTLKFTLIQPNIFSKTYPTNYQIIVNFTSENIRYEDVSLPSEKRIHLGDKTTSNFASSENFVVLECVDRLLEKGYEPKNIHLEHKWGLGRQHKGKLDILVMECDGVTPYLMIECKTWAEEYEKEKARMVKNGGQLFTYFKQDQRAKFLCLYTSKLSSTNGVEFQNLIVDTHSLQDVLGDVKEIYERWNKQFLKSGLLEGTIKPYLTEFRPLAKQDLKDLSDEDSGIIFYQFLEILRHNVISDKANAFNKIFNLFLCKLYDEEYNVNDNLDFQWLQNDSTEGLLGRLNTLYKRGMKTFLDKEITDYSEEEIDGLEDNKELREKFQHLRLYKNQEFAFIEVFNEESFNENAKVVREIVELLQGYKIRYSSKQQFLGNFFERLLNTGFKQESGQFFTPIPLVRFILNSLPIKEIIDYKLKKEPSNFLPYVIDFACGSGHFLTEAMDVIQHEVDKIPSSNLGSSQKATLGSYQNAKYSWAKEYVYGIEKDYRLVKTTKLSCFLNGDGLANIIHASGIAPFNSKHYKDKLEKPNQFDLLIANPPYSVKGFLKTAQESLNDFELLKAGKITDKSGAIELVFIERMTQLIKPEGYSAIIMPSSFLTNDDEATQFTRNILFNHFEIKAVTKLGSGAFMKTGTNTVILFLKKYKKALKYAITKDKYLELVRDKEVLVVESGDKSAEKSFLGYEFSEAKNAKEPIRIWEGLMTKLEDVEGHYPEKSEQVDKVSYYIWQWMVGNKLEIPESLRPHSYYMQLADGFDFEKENFSNALSFKKKITITSKYPLVKLGDMITLESGSRPQGGIDVSLKDGALSIGGTQINLEGSIDSINAPLVPYDFYKKAKNGKVILNDILMCKDGALTGKVGLIRFLDNIPAMVNEHVFIIRGMKGSIIQQYLFYILFQEVFYKIIQDKSQKSAQPGLNIPSLQSVQIPLPSLAEQEAIVARIQEQEAIIDQAKQTIEQAKAVMKSVDFSKYPKVKLGEIILEDDIVVGGDIHKVPYSKIKTEQYSIPIYTNSSTSQPYGYTNIAKVTEEALSISARGTIGFIGHIKEPFYPAVRLIVLVPRKENILYFKYVLENTLQFHNTGSVIGQLTKPNLTITKIPLPSLAEQEVIVAKIQKQEAIIDQAKQTIDQAKTTQKEIMQEVFSIEEASSAT
ncbi:restriction endonuclease subunit S [Entomospira entomophila]|uniref:N-6 DNA methylase n=1 Tax=Entomospira entomophila TaxID=2719988 RepID=A0A968GD44_9SPIO|nr:N-6 DNA methylase [Entomospira entomophilus]NIZ41261.1 N-6 DNA methylase [Entomospira entomophilus]WDI35467.1 restriction endonuclease subunit S [Entomospira entomophilus]